MYGGGRQPRSFEALEILNLFIFQYFRKSAPFRFQTPPFTVIDGSKMAENRKFSNKKLFESGELTENIQKGLKHVYKGFRPR